MAVPCPAPLPLISMAIQEPDPLLITVTHQKPDSQATGSVTLTNNPLLYPLVTPVFLLSSTFRGTALLARLLLPVHVPFFIRLLYTPDHTATLLRASICSVLHSASPLSTVTPHPSSDTPTHIPGSLTHSTMAPPFHIWFPC